MNSLTIESIACIGEDVQPGMIFHPTTNAYIRFLVEPYAKIIDKVINTDLLKRGIYDIFPVEGIAEDLFIVIEEAISGITSQLGTSEIPADLALEIAKQAIIDYLVGEIMNASVRVADEIIDKTVLPWDVQQGAGADKELAFLFKINSMDAILPVTIFNGNQQVTNMLTEEFTCGLFLFVFHTKQTWNISMFGMPFTVNYDSPNNSRYCHQINCSSVSKDSKDYKDSNTGEYTVEVGTSEYTFDTLDFMKGFSIGAKWARIDYNECYRKLTQYTKNNRGEYVGKLIKY
jgi:hypothetical protein